LGKLVTLPGAEKLHEILSRTRRRIAILNTVLGCRAPRGKIDLSRGLLIVRRTPTWP